MAEHPARYDFRGRRVLVAGGTGLIGTPLVRRLIEDEGASVRIASLDDPRRAHSDAEFMPVNLLHHDACLRACEGMAYVFNLLCVKGSPDAVARHPATLFEHNLLLDLNLLRAARARGAEGFLLASSLAVYPPAESFREDDVWSGFPSRHDWFAGWAKRMGELQAEAYRTEFAWNRISVVRPANTYGPHDDFESPAAMVVPSLIRRVARGENPIVLRGGGAQVRDFIHADDVARGMILVARLGVAEPVNLGGGTGITVRELAGIVAACAEPPAAVIADDSPPAGDRVRVLDTSRARALGFVPRVPIAEGIRSTFEWFQATNGDPRGRFDAFQVR